jgi:hypothetical protein
VPGFAVEEMMSRNNEELLVDRVQAKIQEFMDLPYRFPADSQACARLTAELMCEVVHLERCGEIEPGYKVEVSMIVFCAHCGYRAAWNGSYDERYGCDHRLNNGYVTGELDINIIKPEKKVVCDVTR